MREVCGVPGMAFVGVCGGFGAFGPELLESIGDIDVAGCDS